MDIATTGWVATQAKELALLAQAILLSPASKLSVWMLGCGLAIAIGWFCISRRQWPTPRYLRRVLFPKNYLTGRSAMADWIMVIAGYLIFPLTWLATLISIVIISGKVQTVLTAATGQPALLHISPETGRAITTLVAFLAYEFMYWFDHWLMHRVPFLWEFHKVHHTAETLSPVTTFRMHPVDGYLYFILNSLCTGGAIGLCLWAFGPEATPLTIDGANIFILLGFYGIVTLQHSHVWIPFRGGLGRYLLSPAHHQIHHSRNPDHFGSNLGNVLTIWDLLFGTLREPDRRSPGLRFGVDGLKHDPHSLYGLYLAPFIDAANHIKPDQSGDMVSVETEKGQVQSQ